MQPDPWLATLAKLNVYRARGGLAPHKPLLLLVVLDLAEEGLFGAPQPPPSAPSPPQTTDNRKLTTNN